MFRATRRTRPGAPFCVDGPSEFTTETPYSGSSGEGSGLCQVSALDIGLECPLRCPDEPSLDVIGLAFNEQGIAELMCSVVMGGQLRVDAAEPGFIEKSA